MLVDGLWNRSTASRSPSCVVWRVFLMLTCRRSPRSGLTPGCTSFRPAYALTSRASVRHANGTSLDVSSVFAISSASQATSAPRRPAVPQPSKRPKQAKPWWRRAIRLVTFGGTSQCPKTTYAYASAIRPARRSQLVDHSEARNTSVGVASIRDRGKVVTSRGGSDRLAREGSSGW
jgi:hypothetical protein